MKSNKFRYTTAGVFHVRCSRPLVTAKLYDIVIYDVDVFVFPGPQNQETYRRTSPAKRTAETRTEDRTDENNWFALRLHRPAVSTIFHNWRRHRQIFRPTARDKRLLDTRVPKPVVGFGPLRHLNPLTKTIRVLTELQCQPLYGFPGPIGRRRFMFGCTR